MVLESYKNNKILKNLEKENEGLLSRLEKYREQMEM